MAGDRRKPSLDPAVAGDLAHGSRLLILDTVPYC
jgi:hypothetical protein